MNTEQFNEWQQTRTERDAAAACACQALLAGNIASAKLHAADFARLDALVNTVGDRLLKAGA